MIFAVSYAIYKAIAKEKPGEETFSASTGIEHVTSAIPVQWSKQQQLREQFIYLKAVPSMQLWGVEQLLPRLLVWSCVQ